MADSMAIQILKQLKSKRGCSIRDLFYVLPEQYRYTDYSPTHFLMDSLRKLESWGLIQAFDGNGELIQSDKTDLIPPLLNITYYLSPLAAAMEDTLGFSFTGGNQSIFGDPIKSDKWPQLFMLTPFTQELRPVFDDHVKKVTKEMGLTAGRADDFFTIGSIIQDVWSAIHNAVIIIADCTGRNPNVFYEIGIAHTLGKDTILISQSIDDIPFDLRHLRVIVYEYTPRGVQDFEDKLKATLGGVRQS
ncbi:MAG: hypothetical protein ACJ74Q_05660 [Pyrinomonadaceae bacterium]